MEREPVKQLWSYIVESWDWMDASELCLERMRAEATP